MKHFLFLVFSLTLLISCEENRSAAPNTVTDIDDNIYHTVEIGSQTWMASNLKTTKLNDGTKIDHIQDGILWSDCASPAYCYVNNNITNAKTNIGCLYNWYTVNTNKLCPTGWHVPTDEEWLTMELTINMALSEALKEYTWRGLNKEANKLMATYGWLRSGIGIDEVGFSALGAGYRYSNGTFEHVGEQAVWWTSTSIIDHTGRILPRKRDIYYDFGGIYRGRSNEKCGFSIRCIRDY